MTTRRMIYQSLILLIVYLVAECLSERCHNGKLKRDWTRRQKRDIYMTFQDRAQAICIGTCMYHENKSYFRCQRKCKIGKEIPIKEAASRKIAKESAQHIENEHFKLPPKIDDSHNLDVLDIEYLLPGSSSRDHEHTDPGVTTKLPALDNSHHSNSHGLNQHHDDGNDDDGDDDDVGDEDDSTLSDETLPPWDSNQ